MKTFSIKRILVPVDFSETGMLAIDHAASIAKSFSAHLYLLHVAKSIEYAYTGERHGTEAENVSEGHHTASERIDKVVEDLRSRYIINVSPLINVGKLAQGVNTICKDENIDLVIMGTHGASGFEEYVMGSNADKVVDAAPCPVITIQSPVTKTELTNIVMPIDNSFHSRQKIDYVITLAKHYNATIHLLGLYNNLVKEKKFNIKLESAEDAIKKAKLPYVKKVVNCHDVAIEAMKYSYEVRADLLVIMTDHEESRYSGFLLGSKHVINHSKVPVMSIKPTEYYVTGGMYSN